VLPGLPPVVADQSEPLWLDRLGHCWSFPAKQRSACRASYTEFRTVPPQPGVHHGGILLVAET
jgi:hypothetical protein